MSNAHTPAMMAQSMAESLFRENARLKKIEESYYRLLELDSGDVMIDTLNEIDRLKEQNALFAVQVQRVVASFHANMVHAYPDKSHEEIRVEIEHACALAALPQQVKSEDARDAKTLDRAEIMRLAKLSGFYVDQDNPTNEYGVTWYSGTVATLQNFATHVAAISAQEPKGDS